MARYWGWRSRAMVALAVYVAALDVANAQGTAPEVTGNGWIAIAVIAGLVALVVLIISGVLNIARRSGDDDDTAGFGVLEEIDEDEDTPKKKR